MSSMGLEGSLRFDYRFHFGSQADILRCKCNVRFGSKADMCAAKSDVRFTPNSDRESGFPQKVMSALPLKADICGATTDVRFGPKADIGGEVLALTFECRFAAKSKIAIRCTLRQRLSAFQMNSS